MCDHRENSLVLFLTRWPPPSSLPRRYRAVFEGLYGMPIDLPGTALRKALQARDRLRTLLWPEIEDDVTTIVEQARTRSARS